MRTLAFTITLTTSLILAAALLTYLVQVTTVLPQHLGEYTVAQTIAETILELRTTVLDLTTTYDIKVTVQDHTCTVEVGEYRYSFALPPMVVVHEASLRTRYVLVRVEYVGDVAHVYIEAL